MSPKSFFMIVLRIVGLFLLISLLVSLPAAVATISSMAMYDFDGSPPLGLLAVFFLAMVLLLYLIVHFLLLKPEKLIRFLKLDTGFEEEKFELKLSQSSILKIAIIVIGGITLFYEIPYFVKQLFIFWRQTQIKWLEDPDTASLILSIITIVISYLLIYYNDKIVNYITKKSA